MFLFKVESDYVKFQSNILHISFWSTDLSVSTGKLVAVVGGVGSGKSSLVSAILGDMEVLSGNIHVRVKHRTFIYVSFNLIILVNTWQCLIGRYIMYISQCPCNFFIHVGFSSVRPTTSLDTKWYCQGKYSLWERTCQSKIQGSHKCMFSGTWFKHSGRWRYDRNRRKGK